MKHIKTDILFDKDIFVVNHIFNISIVYYTNHKEDECLTQLNS